MYSLTHEYLRILATIPVTVAYGEQSFSKPKLIKTYLRSSMADDILSSLAILSIENDLVQKVNYEEAIKQFSELKARKVLILITVISIKFISINAAIL